ncbi:MAG: pentapeptide repeat-containing protein [Candidatus Nitrosoabyssus spongiisocia]|nr:MAG: pentapeptide repeat-containing protein [Nitrosopumilaceae archaeon AB1(1)]
MNTKSNIRLCQTAEYKTYECNRKCLDDGNFCLFHHKNFKLNEDRIREEFEKELDQVIILGGTLEFIGCKIPSITLREKEYDNISIFFNFAEFRGSVKFIDVKFKAMDFSHARFSEGMYGKKLDVANSFRFNNVKCKDEISELKFENCSLSENDFIGGNFKSLKFIDCELKNTNFQATQFVELRVQNCTFVGKTNFSECVFSTIAEFRNADFKEQHLINFGEDLSKVSFVDTDITRIKFNEFTSWDENHGYTIFDERKFFADPDKHKLSVALTVYRNLRENYEFRLMYEEAGKFFIGEMNLRRKYIGYIKNDDNTKYRRRHGCVILSKCYSILAKSRRRHGYVILSKCYSILANYGESLHRIFLWTLGISVLTIIFFYIELDSCMIDEMMSGNANVVFDSNKLFMALNRYFALFSYTNEFNLTDHFFRLLLIPILGIWFITLRRKFERRFRH